MESYQTSRTLRKARVSNPEEIMANELSKQIPSEMGKQIKKREGVESGEKEKAMSLVREIFQEAERALDLVFSAGVLTSKVHGAEDQAQDLQEPTEDSVRYSASIPTAQMKGDLNKTWKRLNRTSKLIANLFKIEYKDEEMPTCKNNFF